MPHSQRLLVLTLTLEAAIQAENWAEVNELLRMRAEAIDQAKAISKASLGEIGQIEERILDSLRKRLMGVRADMRNLTAALRIAGPYTQGSATSGLSLAS